MTSNNHCPGCNCQVPRQRAPLPDADRAVLQRILDDVRPAAARARITADSKRGVPTEEWIKELAYTPPLTQEQIDDIQLVLNTPIKHRRRLLNTFKLRNKAVANLRASGHTVVRNPFTGEHEVFRDGKSGLQRRIELGLADPISNREREQLAEMKRKLEEKERTRSLLQRLRDKIAETRKKRSS